METLKMATEFAPAERVTDEEIDRQRRLFEDVPLMDQLLNAVPSCLVVLNRQRQLVYANQSLYRALDTGSEGVTVLGSRPGEILKCAHAFESEGGCGTTEFCSTCGALKAILSTQERRSDVQECRIIQDQTSNALDLRVWAKPLVLGKELFTIFAILDISDEKRREALERIFFHDILNTAGGLKGSAELIRDDALEEIPEFRDIILRLSDDLIEEIVGQRQLAAAEREQLAIHASMFSAGDILKEIVELYKGHEVARERHIRIDDRAHEGTLTTDRTLLRRVLGNMTKNALEGSKQGETVTLGCEPSGKGMAFWVHNQGLIPKEARLQIFQRSFSTKGSGRGLGTYSIKLLTERYLKGQVSFETSFELGTVFKVVCPNLQLKEAPTLERQPVSTGKKSSPLRILVAEDNPVNQKLTVRMLEKQGHTAVVADNGNAALAALACEPFDLVLMDCQMPEMDGFEAARIIRKGRLTESADIPIVAMTGHADEESRAACLAAGMNDHVSKPVGKEMLAEVLARWT